MTCFSLQASTDCGTWWEEPDFNNKHLVGVCFFRMIVMMIGLWWWWLWWWKCASRWWSEWSALRLTMTWYDPFMRWNASEHNNIEVASQYEPMTSVCIICISQKDKDNPLQNIRISPDRLWKPDILLYNSASADFYGAYQRCTVWNIFTILVLFNKW